MSENRVSAVVPVYNGEKYLKEAIDSVLAQTRPPFEVIVVDDGSTDQTAEIARSYTEVRIVLQKNQGVAAARNRGVEISEGEYLAFLDADDVWFEHKLERQIGLHQEFSEYGYSITGQRWVLEEGVDSSPWLRADLKEVDHLGYFPSTLVSRRDTFEIVGPFDETLRVGEDIDWFARAKDKGIQIGILEETLLYKRVHHSNLTHDSEKIRSSVLGALKRSIDRQRQNAG